MPNFPRLQSRINHADACSTGNKEAGLVNTSDFPKIPRSILKTRTANNFTFSATTGKICCSAHPEKTTCSN
jgi:hypothetical protein